MGYETCFNCGDRYEAGYANMSLPYGSLFPFCYECNQETVEDFLWDVSKLKENPDLTFYPNLDGEEWAIWNRYADLDTYLTYMNETSNMTFNRDRLDVPSEDSWEIFVVSKDNIDAIETAREALAEKLE